MADGAAIAQELAAKFLRLDVSRREDWDGALASVIATFGRVDLFHLDAGVQASPKGVPLGATPSSG